MAAADAVPAVDESTQASALSLSDADFAALPEPGDLAAPAEDDADDTATEADKDADGEDKDEAAGTADGGKDDTAGSDDSAGADTDTGTDGNADEVPDTADSTAPDYEALYKQLTAPFKANGKDMQVESVNDAIRLMQMGANYNQKMAALKPSLKVLKTLEKNGLLDPEKLNYLIDLDKKNPAAITKLLKDSQISPHDLPVDENTDYKATNYGAADQEIELDNVLESIRHTTHYAKTLEVVGSKWDESSRQIVAAKPQLMKVINDHMISGVYDRISTAVEKERMFGRLTGMSDIEAYRATGDRLEAEGKFADLFSEPAKPAASTPAAKPAAKAQDDTTRKDKRRAASLTQTAAAKADKPDFNPLALSDEAFLKQFDERLL